MKVALNNRNIILRSADDLLDKINYCRNCCFTFNVYLCFNLALRDNSICRTMKIPDDFKLNDIFKL